MDGWMITQWSEKWDGSMDGWQDDEVKSGMDGWMDVEKAWKSNLEKALKNKDEKQQQQQQQQKNIDCAWDRYVFGCLCFDRLLSCQASSTIKTSIMPFAACSTVMSKNKLEIYLYGAFIQLSAFIHLQMNVLNDWWFWILILTLSFLQCSLLNTTVFSYTSQTLACLKGIITKCNGKKLPHIITFPPYRLKS